MPLRTRTFQGGRSTTPSVERCRHVRRGMLNPISSKRQHHVAVLRCSAISLEHGKRELRRLEGVPRSARTALAYRNWLMLTMLCVLPLRLRNFAALALGRHLNRGNDVWCVDFDANETKTGRPLAALMPRDLGRFLDRYLTEVRPRLDYGEGDARLWLSRSGHPLADHSIYVIITELTRRTFGIAINPHQFRHTFTTSVSFADPEAIEGARAALGHAVRLSTRRHYVHATALAAARIHAKIVCRMRNKAGKNKCNPFRIEVSTSRDPR